MIARLISLNEKAHPLAKEALYIVAGAFLLALLSQISIPLKPVPVNLQTVGVLVIGLTYAPRAAFLSLVMFIMMGAAGLPVFSNFSGGAHILVGPTAGYLMSFPVAAGMMALLKERFDLTSRWHLLALACLGQTIVFMGGVGWLSHLIGAKNALLMGFLPFLLPGIAKTIITTAMVAYLRKA